MPTDEPISALLSSYERIFTIVSTIPRGKVMTYGQLAALVREVGRGPVPALQVGRAMAASARYAPDLPWWRVIGRSGKYGVLRSLRLSHAQRELLAAEGVLPDEEGRYALTRYLFSPIISCGQ